MEKVIILKNKSFKITNKFFAYLLLLSVLTGVVLQIFGEYHFGLSENDVCTNEWQRFCKIVLRDYLFFYTNQSNILLGIYALMTIFNYKKQSIMGIISLGNMSIVCMFFWIGYGIINFDFNWNIFINIASILNHGINILLGIVVFILYCVYIRRDDTYKYQDVLKYFLIVPFFFVCCDIIMNFSPFFSKDGSTGYSPYGFASAINPNIKDGDVWHIIFIPFFFLAALVFCSFFYFLNNLKFFKNINKFDEEEFAVERKINSFSSLLIIILSIISYILLLFAQIYIDKEQFTHKTGLTGWIYGMLLSMFFFIFFIVLYNSVKYYKFKNKFILIKLFSSISLYYLLFIFLIYFILILSYFNIFNIDAYFNPYMTIVVFGNLYIVLALSNFFIWFYSGLKVRIIEENYEKNKVEKIK